MLWGKCGTGAGMWVALTDTWRGPVRYFSSLCRWQHAVSPDTYSGPQPDQMPILCIPTGQASNHVGLLLASGGGEHIEYFIMQRKVAALNRWGGQWLLRPGRGAEYCDRPVCLFVCVCVCLSVSIYLEPVDRYSRNLLCRSPMAAARSSSGGVARRYVLPVLWMTSLWPFWAVWRNVVETERWSDYHERRCDTGAESDVYEWTPC